MLVSIITNYTSFIHFAFNKIINKYNVDNSNILELPIDEIQLKDKNKKFIRHYLFNPIVGLFAPPTESLGDGSSWDPVRPACWRVFYRGLAQQIVTRETEILALHRANTTFHTRKKKFPPWILGHNSAP